jgi:hypothetical protein
MDGPGPLDFDSIMMYGSARGLLPGVPVLPENVIIYRYIMENGRKIPAWGTDWWIDGFTRDAVPSAGDADFVRRFYAWDQQRYVQWHHDPNRKRAKAATALLHSNVSRMEEA